MFLYRIYNRDILVIIKILKSYNYYSQHKSIWGSIFNLTIWCAFLMYLECHIVSRDCLQQHWDQLQLT